MKFFKNTLRRLFRTHLHPAHIQHENSAKLSAINKVMGVIEFDLAGNILSVNDNFAAVTGYRKEEILGRHHSMFVEERYRLSQDYKQFWEKLGRGEFLDGQYKRVGKGGKEIWLQATYNPIMDAEGKVFKIVKYATDITAEKQAHSDFTGQINAIHKVMGVIEFDLAGNILSVNDNFAAVTGYRKEEILGRHHSMFVEERYRLSQEYKQFWEKLGRGEFLDGQYKRVGKGGKEIWLQATYNPIMDAEGKVFKIVKYATDITQKIVETKALSNAVSQTSRIVELIKQGDLSYRLDTTQHAPEIKTLSEGINSIVDSMVDVLTVIDEASDAIKYAASELTKGNADLSTRTDYQAIALEKTAASMEQISSNVRNNAQNSKQANLMTVEAFNVANEGTEVFKNVVTTMQGIKESATRIEEIITVIDSIAFQTNILALNAAVEAARAGEQGRGFAVVASEVRNLAQRSSIAAKEIKTLINDSSNRVIAGSEYVEIASEKIHALEQKVKHTSDYIEHITHASFAQSEGIHQVQAEVIKMEQMTLENSKLVEKASAASVGLLEQSSLLEQTLRKFRIEQEASLLSGHEAPAVLYDAA